MIYNINNSHSYINRPGSFLLSVFLEEPLLLVAQLEFIEYKFYSIKLASQFSVGDPVATMLKGVSKVTDIISASDLTLANLEILFESNNIRRFEE